MKIFLLFLCLFGLTVAQKLEDNEHGDMRRWLSGGFYRTMKFIIWAKTHMTDIKSYINEYFDKLTGSFDWGNQTDVDYITLDNVSQTFNNAHIYLRNGSLHGLEHIYRNEDATIGYSHKERKIVVTMPMVLKDLQFLYDYRVALPSTESNGRMVGSIDKFKAFMNMTFDFNDYHFKINKLSNWGMGKITVTFQGPGISNDTANLLSEFAVSVLHPQIETIIGDVIDSISTKFVVNLNEAIDNVMNSNSTDSDIIGDGSEFLQMFQSFSNRNL